MTMKRFFAGCVLACLAAGCASVNEKKEAEQPSITVSKTTGIITIDGKLDLSLKVIFSIPISKSSCMKILIKMLKNCGLT